MEVLYNELREKYQKLKTQIYSELGQMNHEQELKFVGYVLSAEEVIDHLKTVNKRLSEQLMASNRSVTDQCSEYQKQLLIAKNQKKELSEEVERLQKLLLEGCQYNNQYLTNHNNLLMPTLDSQGGSRNLCAESTVEKARKPSMRQFGTQTEEMRIIPYASHKEILPNCCWKMANPADSGNDSSKVSCLFQILLQSMVGMKIFVVNQTECLSISALHEASGFCFSLTFVNSSVSGDAELLYRNQSLGTLQRVAPEWMREEMMFGLDMCGVFFQRVSRVISLRS